LVAVPVVRFAVVDAIYVATAPLWREDEVKDLSIATQDTAPATQSAQRASARSAPASSTGGEAV
jgi:hypothetical protein